MEIIKFKPNWKKENGLVVIYDSSVPLPIYLSGKTRSCVFFPPGAIGGNHRHPRVEAFYSFGDLTFVYLDENEEKKEVSMAPEDDKYKLFIVPSNLSHAVVNRTNMDIVLVEFANEEQHDIEKVELV